MARFADITPERLESGDDGRIQVQSPDKGLRVRYMVDREVLGQFDDELAGFIRDVQYGGIVLTLEGAMRAIGIAQAQAWGPLASGKRTMEVVLLEIINKRIADPDLRKATIEMYRDLGFLK